MNLKQLNEAVNILTKYNANGPFVIGPGWVVFGEDSSARMTPQEKKALEHYGFVVAEAQNGRKYWAMFADEGEENQSSKTRVKFSI